MEKSALLKINEDGEDQFYHLKFLPFGLNNALKFIFVILRQFQSFETFCLWFQQLFRDNPYIFKLFNYRLFLGWG